MDHRASFDLDLKYGQIGEQLLADILAGKIEVKTERGTWRATGNIAIEYSSRGKKSGIMLTKSAYWCTILMDGEDVHNIILTPINRLRKIFIRNYKEGRKVKGGDNNTSELVLVSIEELMTWTGD
jgi:hypothetical protein